MKLQLDQNEIEKALAQYIGNRMDLRGQLLTIDFTAGRKPGGLLADLTIEEVSLARAGYLVRPETGSGSEDEHQTISGHDTEVPSMEDLGIGATASASTAAIESTEQPAEDPVAEAETKPESTTTDSLFGGA